MAVKRHQWKLNSDLTDSVGAVPLSVSSAISYQSGIFDNALYLTAAGGYAGVPVSASSYLNPGANGFACGFWLYYDGTNPTKNGRVIGVFNSGTSQRCWAMIMNNAGGGTSSVLFSVDGSTTDASIAIPALAAGLYKIGISVFAGTNQALVNINGANIGTVTLSGSLFTVAGATRFMLLNDDSAGSNSYDWGWIDNVEYWDGGLTDTEWAAQYFDSLSSNITLTPQSPTSGATGVEPNARISFDIDDDGNTLDLTQTIVDITTINGTDTAYDGGSGGYQTGWIGDAPSVVGTGPSQIQFTNLFGAQEFAYEDLISLRVRSANDKANTLDETYSFTIGQEVSENLNKNYCVTRVLLDIDLHDRHYYYSDQGGMAHSYSTSTDGRVIVQDDVKLYKKVILNAGQIKESFDPKNTNVSVGNISIKLFNEDNLHLGNKPVSLESGTATVYYIRGDMYDEVIASYSGSIDKIKFDDTELSFSIVSSEEAIYYNVPEIILDEETFQIKQIMFNPEVREIVEITGRYAAWYYGNDVKAAVAKKIGSPVLAGREDDFWKGARIDVIDATDDLAVPETIAYSIGEFAVVVKSEDDYVQLPTVMDRYFLYDMIDDSLRDTTLGVPNAPYEVRDVLNNTMHNITRVGKPVIYNGTFDTASYWFLGTGWSISSGKAIKTTGSTGILSQDLRNSGFYLLPDQEYKVKFNLLSWGGGTPGDITVQLDSGSIVNFDPTGISLPAMIEIIAQAPSVPSSHLLQFSNVNTTTSYEIDDVSMESISGDLTMQIIKNGIPENADSVGRPFPLVYGKVEKIWAVWATSSKSTRQNSMSAGDDLYVIAGHRIVDKSPTEVTVYWGLDENAEQQTFKPGSLWAIPNPFPKSITEMEHWNETGYSMVDTVNTDRNVSPFHKLIEVTTNKGDVVTAVKLRGDEYGGFLANENPTNNVDSIANVAGSTWRVTDSAASLTPSALIGKTIAISEASNYYNNGIFPITANGATTIDYTNVNGVADASSSAKYKIGLFDTDDQLPGINGEPQFPIRYGLGSSKFFVSFRGMPDETGAITGVPGGLIEHPIDILKHFLLYHTNIDRDVTRIDEQSFADAKAKLENWRFGMAITDVVDGSEVVERILGQCKSFWSWKNNQFSVKTLDLNATKPKFFLDEDRHFVSRPTFSRPALKEISNDFIVRYGYNQMTEKYDRVITRNRRNDYLCRNSYAIYGVTRSHKEIELPDVYDSFTANALTDHVVALNALSRLTMDVDIRMTEDIEGIGVADVVEVALTRQVSDYNSTLWLITDIATQDNHLQLSMLELISL